MQVVKQDSIIERLLFYWAKLYSQSIKQGEDYNVLKRSIIIMIADFELDSLKFIKKYMTKWKIREDDYSSIVLTDAFEAVILELPKFMKYSNLSKSPNMNLWVKLFEKPEVNIMEEFENNYDTNNPDLKKTVEAIQLAQARLQQLSEDEHERELAELREKYILDQNSIERTRI